jgi:hypothetical protein
VTDNFLSVPQSCCQMMMGLCIPFFKSIFLDTDFRSLDSLCFLFLVALRSSTDINIMMVPTKWSTN